jgi:hypothetical protein
MPSILNAGYKSINIFGSKTTAQECKNRMNEKCTGL